MRVILLWVLLSQDSETPRKFMDAELAAKDLMRRLGYPVEFLRVAYQPTGKDAGQQWYDEIRLDPKRAGSSTLFHEMWHWTQFREQGPDFHNDYTDQMVRKPWRIESWPILGPKVTQWRADHAYWRNPYEVEAYYFEKKWERLYRRYGGDWSQAPLKRELLRDAARVEKIWGERANDAVRHRVENLRARAASLPPDPAWRPSPRMQSVTSFAGGYVVYEALNGRLPTQLDNPEFWASGAVFTAGSMGAESLVSRVTSSGLLRRSLPLAAGVALADYAMTGRFDWKEFAINTGSILLASYAVDLLLPAIAIGTGPVGIGVFLAYQAVKAGLILYGADWIGKGIRGLLGWFDKKDKPNSRKQGFVELLESLGGRP